MGVLMYPGLMDTMRLQNECEDTDNGGGSGDDAAGDGCRGAGEHRAVGCRGGSRA